MRTIKPLIPYFLVLTLGVLITKYSKGQNMPHKIQEKLHGLYPEYKYIGGSGPRTKMDNSNENYTQVEIIICNCKEYGGEITITFDTNANVISKEYESYGYSDLPKSVLRYLKDNEGKNVKLEEGSASKIVTSKGKITYSFIMNDNGKEYIIIVKGNGKLVSKTLYLRPSE